MSITRRRPSMSTSYLFILLIWSLLSAISAEPPPAPASALTLLPIDQDDSTIIRQNSDEDAAFTPFPSTINLLDEQTPTPSDIPVNVDEASSSSAPENLAASPQEEQDDPDNETFPTPIEASDIDITPGSSPATDGALLELSPEPESSYPTVSTPVTVAANPRSPTKTPTPFPSSSPVEEVSVSPSIIPGSLDKQATPTESPIPSPSTGSSITPDVSEPTPTTGEEEEENGDDPVAVPPLGTVPETDSDPSAEPSAEEPRKEDDSESSAEPSTEPDREDEAPPPVVIQIDQSPTPSSSPTASESFIVPSLRSPPALPSITTLSSASPLASSSVSTSAAVTTTPSTTPVSVSVMASFNPNSDSGVTPLPSSKSLASVSSSPSVSSISISPSTIPSASVSSSSSILPSSIPSVSVLGTPSKSPIPSSSRTPAAIISVQPQNSAIIVIPKEPSPAVSEGVDDNDAMPTMMPSVDATEPEPSSVLASPFEDANGSETDENDDIEESASPSSTPTLLNGRQAENSPSPTVVPLTSVVVFPPTTTDSTDSASTLPSISLSPSVSDVIISIPTSSAAASVNSFDTIETVSASPSVLSSQGPDAVTNADTIIVPDNNDDDDDDPEESPGESLGPNPVIPEQVPTNPEAVGAPDTNDTDIVNGPDGGSNTTLADNDSEPPSVIAEGQYKDLIRTGPAGRAFVPVMAIVGVLLVILLLVCLFFAIFYGAGREYSYNSQLRPSEYGSTVGGGGGGGGGGGPYGSGSTPESYEQDGTSGYGQTGGGGPVRGGSMGGAARGSGAEEIYAGVGGGRGVGGVQYAEGHDGQRSSMVYGADDSQEYAIGQATTLKNASIGTAEYSTPGQLATELQVGGAGGALTGYEDDDNEDGNYEYSHPYGEPYQGEHRQGEGNTGEVDDTRISFEEVPYGGVHTRDTYATSQYQEDDNTQDMYEGIPYAEENIPHTLDGYHEDSSDHDERNATHTGGRVSEARSKFEAQQGKIHGSSTINPTTNRLSTVRETMTIGETFDLPQSRQAGSTLEVPRSAGSGQSGHDDENPFEASHILSGPVAAVAQRYTQNPRKSRLAFLFGRTSTSHKSVAKSEAENPSTSSSGSNPAITPYEEGISIEASSEDEQAVNMDMQNHMLPTQYQPGETEKTGEDAHVGGYEIDHDDSQQSTEDEDLSQSSHTPPDMMIPPGTTSDANSGPWPSWWKKNNAGELMEGEVLEHSDENNFSNGNENVGEANYNCSESGDENDGVTSVTKGQAIFGSTRVLGDSDWQRSSHRVKSGKKELDPEFDYLRQRREPYVKVVANRLSHRALSNSPISEEEIRAKAVLQEHNAYYNMQENDENRGSDSFLI